ncbi:MAG: hypothetical protein KatS3mg045_0957 [Bellilinea sp.]|nr:MAG: hypothetical protein KatS3mg045_0957 [Bellilinea sp.]
MIKKIYRGEPGGAVKVILQSGKSRPLRHVVLHSPTGFGWGYGSSGPADLALSILCDLFGERPSKKRLYYGRFKAQPHYQAFKREFVAGWEFGGGFEIDSETIASWLRKRGVEVQP